MQALPHPPNDEGMTELQKSYSDLITRTGRFIVSTLIVLVVLTVVIEQQIREYDRKIVRQNQIQKDIAKSIKRASGRLKDSFRYIPDFLKDKKKRVENHLTVDDLPKLKLRMNKEELEGVNQRLNAYTGAIWRLIEETSKKPQSKKPPKPQAEDDDVDKEEVKLENLNRAIEAINRYKDSINERSLLVQRKEVAEQDIKSLSSSKKSIPTPFGSFEVIPQQALFALAFASLITYLMVNLSFFQARAYARKYYTVSGGQKTISSPVPSPFWLYNREPDMDRILTWSQRPMMRLALSFVLHAGWIALAGWLTWECLWKWRSSETLLFDFKLFWDYLLFVCFIIAVTIAVWQFARPTFRSSLMSSRVIAESYGRRINRRAFLRVWTLGVLGASIVAAAYIFRPRSAKGKKPCKLRRSELAVKIEPKDWVLNKNTKVLHHKYYCNHKMPDEKYIAGLDEAGSDDFCIHSSRAANILYQLANNELGGRYKVWRLNWRLNWRLKRSVAAALSLAAGNSLPIIWRKAHQDENWRQRYENGIPYLQRAIALSPDSFHLYDRLVRVYGRLHRYNEIESLLNGALARVERAISSLPEKARTKEAERELKLQTRVKKGFQLRIQAMEERKKRSNSKRLERLLKELG